MILKILNFDLSFLHSTSKTNERPSGALQLPPGSLVAPRPGSALGHRKLASLRLGFLLLSAVQPMAGRGRLGKRTAVSDEKKQPRIRNNVGEDEERGGVTTAGVITVRMGVKQLLAGRFLVFVIPSGER
ncbi:hypothetical protein Vafri_12698 [Volvox africanus]|uniref:Uncharacterized protein n=1 Tax=Volvox africanus TaxID=51714 RepID=A0A8J4BAP5_9CHLO|nr:hypothetical protein Vafri_12698 [Volvox africanus]